MTAEAFVIDASAFVPAALAGDSEASFGGYELSAPGLFWSEAASTLHALRWREVISKSNSDRAFKRLIEARVEADQPAGLLQRAWSVADRLGWARTYDAEYVALAELRQLPLLTLDARLQRGAARLVETVAPADLAP